MSNHFDGYTAANQPKLDLSDIYVLKGDTGTVLIANTNPGSSAAWNGPGWDTEAIYQWNLDLIGDRNPDIGLRAQFTGHTHDDGSPSAQRWSLSLHFGHESVTDPESLGVPLLANAKTDTVHEHFGIKMFAGLAGEPFYIDFNYITPVRTAVTEGTVLDMSGFNPDTAVNSMKDTNVNTIAIEIPNGFGLFNGITMGAWATVTIPTDDGDNWRQVDRDAHPMLSTVYGFNVDDDYNMTSPVNDDQRWGGTIEELTETVVAANDSHRNPAAYAAEIRDRIMPDILKYRVGSKADYNQHRNGRNLKEDVVHGFTKTATNMDVPTGLDYTDATGSLRDRFPYLSEPVGQ